MIQDKNTTKSNPSAAHTRPKFLWGVLDREQKQQVREQCIMNLATECPRTVEGTMMYWSPENQFKRRILFNLLDTWWNDTRAVSRDRKSQFQKSIEILIEDTDIRTTEPEFGLEELQRKIEKEELSIPPVVVQWVFEHIARNQA